MAHGEAKLTDDDVRKIRILANTKATQREIAKLFGVCQGTVWGVINGTKWHHVV
jgi:IS30 family transposase